MKLVTPLLFALLSAVSVLVCKSDQVKSVKTKRQQEDSETPPILSFTKVLSNGRQIPLIGMGVGNLQLGLIDEVTSLNLSMGSRLIDTARASKNEKAISAAIGKTLEGSARTADGSDENVVHVVTKVWYTHLGYERTMISVAESLHDLTTDRGVDIRVHILLHWPRCDDGIAWMNCEGEENLLPQYVRDAGPPPHLDKDNAWAESWKALEDSYVDDRRNRDTNMGRKPLIESIGVSNFNTNDMTALLDTCRIKPFIYQGNVWTVLHDPKLMGLLSEHHILFQAYNIIHGIFDRKSAAPNAFAVLGKVGAHVWKKRGGSGSGSKVTEAMIIMAWLVQQGISVIPRASSYIHQRENTPATIKSIPRLESDEIEKVKAAMSALMKGEDFTEVKAVFHNNFVRSIQLFWLDKKTGEEKPITKQVEPGVQMAINSHPGHTFVAYCSMKKLRREYTITGNYGDSNYFSVHGEL